MDPQVLLCTSLFASKNETQNLPTDIHTFYEHGGDPSFAVCFCGLEWAEVKFLS